MADHDSLYHRLFAHPLMVEQLLRGFVPAAAAAGLDFARMTRIGSKFHDGRAGKHGSRRESDVIWRLPTVRGTDMILLLLLEFQSVVDRWMAVRTQVYEGLLWQQLIAEGKLAQGRLPPVLLVVLHNGARRWRAPTALEDLIALPPDSPLWPWQPRARYHVLDMGALPSDSLSDPDNLAVLLFRLEQPQDPETLAAALGEVAGWFRRHPDHATLRTLFTELVHRALESCGEPAAAVPDDMKEVRTMFATIGAEWKRQARAEGRAEGRAAALTQVLTSRFGVLPDAVVERVAAADVDTLDGWLKRVLTAATLDAVLAPDP